MSWLCVSYRRIICLDNLNFTKHAHPQSSPGDSLPSFYLPACPDVSDPQIVEYYAEGNEDGEDDRHRDADHDECPEDLESSLEAVKQCCGKQVIHLSQI